jgi:hypothetical protein
MIKSKFVGSSTAVGWTPVPFSLSVTAQFLLMHIILPRLAPLKMGSIWLLTPGHPGKAPELYILDSTLGPAGGIFAAQTIAHCLTVVQVSVHGIDGVQLSVLFKISGGRNAHAVTAVSEVIRRPVIALLATSNLPSKLHQRNCSLTLSRKIKLTISKEPALAEFLIDTAGVALGLTATGFKYAARATQRLIERYACLGPVARRGFA